MTLLTSSHEGLYSGGGGWEVLEHRQTLVCGLGKPDQPPTLPTAFWAPIEPRLIGLAGKARVGKDTVAKILQDTFKAETLAFARPLKEGLKTMLNLTDEHVHGDLKEIVIEDFGKSPRQMLQTLGTDWGRILVSNDIWLTVARRQIEAWLDEGKHVVITDVRFDNEAELIRKIGGIIWHINRDSAVSVNAHMSEAGVKQMPEDVQIYNNGSMEDLFESACDHF